MDFTNIFYNSFFIDRSGHRRCSVRKDVLKKFTKFTEKQPVPEHLFLVKLQATACNFIKKETLAQVLSCEFCEFFKDTFFTEHLRWSLPHRTPKRLANLPIGLKDSKCTSIIATIHSINSVDSCNSKNVNFNS